MIIPLGSARGDQNFRNYILTHTEFLFDEKFKLLGLEIDNNLLDLDNNFINAINKIRNILRFWGRFNLSIHGRVNVAKTYALSQLAYIGTITNPSANILNEIEDTIVSFIKGRDTISKNRIFSSTSSGGLNFPKILDFLEAIRINLYKKAISSNDFWTIPIKSSMYSEQIPYIINKDNPILNYFPFSNIIVKSYCRYLKKFNLEGNNYKKMQIFGNQELFQQYTRHIENFTPNIFRPHLRNVQNILKLSAEDLIDFDTGIAKNKASIEANIGFDLNLNEYLRLSHIANTILIINRQKSNNQIYTPPKLLTKIFFTKTPGSKKFREQIPTHAENNFFINRLGQINLQGNPENRKASECFNKCLSLSFIKNDIKQIGFKFMSNTLFTNSRIGHFVDNLDERCNFCRSVPFRVAARETNIHIFGECESVTHIRYTLFDIISCPLSDIRSILVGSHSKTNIDNTFDNIVITLYIHFIYTHKHTNMIPTRDTFLRCLKSAIETYCAVSRSFSNNITNLKKKYPNNTLLTEIENDS